MSIQPSDISQLTNLFEKVFLPELRKEIERQVDRSVASHIQMLDDHITGSELRRHIRQTINSEVNVTITVKEPS